MSRSNSDPQMDFFGRFSRSSRLDRDGHLRNSTTVSFVFQMSRPRLNDVQRLIVEPWSTSSLIRAMDHPSHMWAPSCQTVTIQNANASTAVRMKNLELGIESDLMKRRIKKVIGKTNNSYHVPCMYHTPSSGSHTSETKMAST